MKSPFFAIAALLVSFTSAHADPDLTEYVCTFNAVAVRMETQVAASSADLESDAPKVFYRVKLKELAPTFFNANKTDQRIAVVQRGYYDATNVFHVTAVQSHDVTREDTTLAGRDITNYTGEFFDLTIENQKDAPARVSFSGFGNAVSTFGKCGDAVLN